MHHTSLHVMVSTRCCKVLHTYAAHCLTVLLLLKGPNKQHKIPLELLKQNVTILIIDRPRLPADHINQILPTVGPCLQILATDNTRSAYEMKLVMRKGCYLICYLCVELMTHVR